MSLVCHELRFVTALQLVLRQLISGTPEKVFATILIIDLLSNYMSKNVK